MCTNTNRCFCDIGFAGPDCAIVVPVTTVAPTEPPPTADNTIKMEKKETPYGKQIVATLKHVILSKKKGKKLRKHFLEENYNRQTNDKNTCFSRESSVKLAKWKKNELFR